MSGGLMRLIGPHRRFRFLSVAVLLSVVPTLFLSAAAQAGGPSGPDGRRKLWGARYDSGAADFATDVGVSPDGLTVFDAAGQWRDPARGRIVREPSKVVLIVFRDEPQKQEHLDAIADAYKRRFKQQSVGIVIRPACASF